VQCLGSERTYSAAGRPSAVPVPVSTRSWTQRLVTAQRYLSSTPLYNLYFAVPVRPGSAVGHLASAGPEGPGTGTGTGRHRALRVLLGLLLLSGGCPASMGSRSRGSTGHGGACRGRAWGLLPLQEEAAGIPRVPGAPAGPRGQGRCSAAQAVAPAAERRSLRGLCLLRRLRPRTQEWGWA